MKILMVCLGNICRSPLAEGILKSKVGEEHFVDSAGTGNWHAGELPDKRSIEVAKNNGVDLSDQRARQFTQEDFETFDLILTMDKSNYTDLIKLDVNNEFHGKVKPILESSPELGSIVPDPYYGEFSDFEAVYELLDKATDQLIQQYNL